MEMCNHANHLPLQMLKEVISAGFILPINHPNPKVSLILNCEHPPCFVVDPNDQKLRKIWPHDK